MDNLLVTIAIPCYNHAGFVQDSIRSVINQTYENIEFIIKVLLVTFILLLFGCDMDVIWM